MGSKARALLPTATALGLLWDVPFSDWAKNRSQILSHTWAQHFLCSWSLYFFKGQGTSINCPISENQRARAWGKIGVKTEGDSSSSVEPPVEYLHARSQPFMHYWSGVTFLESSERFIEFFSFICFLIWFSMLSIIEYISLFSSMRAISGCRIWSTIYFGSIAQDMRHYLEDPREQLKLLFYLVDYLTIAVMMW